MTPFGLVNSRPDQFTWWSNRGRAWENNVGWRIDYQMVTKDLADLVEKATIYKKSRFSDHAPLSITYKYSLKIEVLTFKNRILGGQAGSIDSDFAKQVGH